MNFNNQNAPRKPSVPAPQGPHAARCIFIVDLGTQTSTWQGQTKTMKKVQIGFELVETVMPTTNPGEQPRPFIKSREFTASMDSKANLRKFVEGWIGKTMSEDEAKNVGVSSSVLMQTPCIVSIIHKRKDDGSIRDDINSAMPPMQGMQIRPAQNPTVVFEIGSPSQFEDFKKCYGWIQDKIILSPEFQQQCQMKLGMTAANYAAKCKEERKAQMQQNNPQQGAYNQQYPQQGGYPQQQAMQPNQQFFQQPQTQNPYGNQAQYPQQGGFQQPVPQQQPAPAGFGAQTPYNPNPQPTQNGGFGAPQQQGFGTPINQGNDSDSPF